MRGSGKSGRSAGGSDIYMDIDSLEAVTWYDSGLLESR